ncbi:MAG: hypothetical protein GX851_05645 [Clostridiales bacterium]|nr:hypothetical protein [Clostridiales bacterium]
MDFLRFGWLSDAYADMLCYQKSHNLVKEMNKSWTPGASGSADMYNHPFENAVMDIFSCKLPFTRESWHGRMCACRGTMASMDAQTLEKWSERHMEMLGEYSSEFTVNHKVYIAAYKIEK